MSRFGPQVAPRVGPAWTQQLADALQGGMGLYEHVKDRQRFDERQQLQDALMTQQLGEQGIHKGQAPLAPAPLQIKSVPGAFNPMTGTFDPGGVMGQAPSMNSPLQPQAGVTQLTKGYYQDANEAGANRQAAFQAELADALAKRDAMRPGAMQDYREQKQIDQEYSTHIPPQPKSLSQVDVGGRVILTRPDTGEEVTSYAKTPSPKNPNDPKDPALRNPTEFQQRASFLYPRAAQALGTIHNYMKGHPTGPSDTAKGLSRVGLGNMALSADDQKFYQAAQVAATAIVRMESGANTPESEISRMVGERSPQIGDKPEVIQQKLQTLEADVQRLGELAAPAMRGSPMAPGQSPSTGNIDLTKPKTYSPTNPFAPRNR